MQFATLDKIFLLDMITLDSVLLETDWMLLASAIFCNEDVATLGLTVSITNLKGIKILKISSYLCLRRFSFC